MQMSVNVFHWNEGFASFNNGVRHTVKKVCPPCYREKEWVCVRHLNHLTHVVDVLIFLR